eukprot:926102-Alexandrium_andersonii.AAC.1
MDSREHLRLLPLVDPGPDAPQAARAPLAVDDRTKEEHPVVHDVGGGRRRLGQEGGTSPTRLLRPGGPGLHPPEEDGEVVEGAVGCPCQLVGSPPVEPRG